MSARPARSLAHPLRALAPAPATPSAASVLDALAFPVFVVDAEDHIVAVNLAAEHFFDSSAHVLRGHGLADYLPPDHPLFTLIALTRDRGASLSEEEVTLEGPRLAAYQAAVTLAPLFDRPGEVAVSIHGRSIAARMEQHFSHRNAARSVTAMAQMLAHEVKNPLSGIRGAAQLLERAATVEDQALARLIVDEADRICDLVDRMEAFADSSSAPRSGVNIHAVLEHVRRLALNGFAHGLSIIERYDPSLPPVWGNRDQLIQIFLNLVKNAAEAVDPAHGEIVLATSYHHGMRLALPGSDVRVHLPLTVTVQDNGPGIPEDLRPHLFDPFVSTKPQGTGLGLALVAKLVGEHGGFIDLACQPGRTSFTLRFPLMTHGVI